jgi:hypothetical protein
VYTTTADTVTDTVTKLVWQRATGTPNQWGAAIAYCDGLTLGGFSDWRLPTVAELLSIVDYGRSTPSINLVAFPGTSPTYFWSSSPYAPGSNLAWAVLFDYGLTIPDPTTNNRPMRCVR